MSKYQLSPAQVTAFKTMASLGFTHAKIELEAQLDRNDDEDSYSSCDDCHEGYNDCYSCDGTGVVSEELTAPNGRELELTSVCDDCDGDGHVTCSTCDGDYESSGDDSWDNDRCEEFLHNHVSPEARRSLNYSRFYNDGSVDSEFTFTLPVADLAYAVEYLDAFNALAQEIGNGMDTDGAGMHLSVLTSSRYPTNTPLDRDKIANFKREVIKLLPALYFNASPDYSSRALNYRPPRISSDKYAAISTHGDTSLEYRIFETCYQRPTALLENFEVIAHTLKYYSNRKLKLPTPTFALGEGQGLARFYNTPEKLKALNDGLPFIKPKDKTIATLKRERNFKITLKDLKLTEKINQRRYQADYDEYVKAVERDNQEFLANALGERIKILDILTRQPAQRNYLNRHQEFLASEEAGDVERVQAWLVDRGRFAKPLPIADWIAAQAGSRQSYSFAGSN